MDPPTTRRRGRPPRSTTAPSDLGASIWIRVQIYRIEERIRTGKTPSVARTCRGIMARGGIQSVVGGNLEALAKANLTRKVRWLQFSVRFGWLRVECGCFRVPFFSHRIESATSLHARYSEANKLANADPFVRLAWMNMARKLLGRAVKMPRWATPWKPPSWRVRADGTFVLASN